MRSLIFFVKPADMIHEVSVVSMLTLTCLFCKASLIN